MNINLYKNYYLKSDPLNYTLYQKRTVDKGDSDSDGKKYEQIEGYYSTIEHAIRAMCTKEIRACKCTTLNGLIKEVRKLEDVVAGLCNEIGADNIVANIIQLQKDDNPLVMDNTPEKEGKSKKRGRKKKVDKK